MFHFIVERFLFQYKGFAMQELAEEYYKNNGKDSLFLHHSPKIIFEKLNKKFKLKTIKEFLKQQKDYTLYRRNTGNNFKRNPYRVYHIDQTWEMDLLSLPSLSQFNSGYAHLLVCIDLFSRFAFVRSLRTKQPREIIKNLVDIFRTHNRRPNILRSDRGGEFNNKQVKSFLNKENIELRFPHTTLVAKCAFVESLNKSIRQYISRYLNWKRITGQPNENRYVDAIQALVDNYNHTRHSRLKIAPANVTKSNATQVYHRQKMQIERIKAKNPRLKQNEFVRVKRKRGVFEKATFLPQWSSEIYRINRVISRRPYPVYEIRDLKGREVEGKFYEQELQQIGLPLDTPIEIVQRPSIFERNKKVKTRTLIGNTRILDLNEEKQKNKENNYSDVLSFLSSLTKNKK